MRAFTTQDCAFCYVSKGLLTGCRPGRGPNQDGHCAKCKSKLPPKGTIYNVRSLMIIGEDEEQVASGHMMKILRASDACTDWYLCYASGGTKSPLFPLIGSSAEAIKKWIKDNGYTAKWPAGDTKGRRRSLLPFNREEESK